MRRWGMVLAGALALTACKAGDKDHSAGSTADNRAASDFANRMTGTAKPVQPAARPYNVADKTALLDYAYSYPAEAAAIPALVEKFGKDAVRAKTDALNMARDDSAAAKTSGFPFRPHELQTVWSVTADTPRFLALQSENYVYTGGAHGMTGYESLLWDKERKRETSVKAVMTSPAAFRTAIRDRFCAELDRQRAKKRGEAVKRGEDDFTQCIDPMEQVLTLTSKDGGLINAVTFLVGPYAAGPYAEGSYDIPVPIDAATYKAIKTEYQDGFVKP